MYCTWNVCRDDVETAYFSFRNQSCMLNCCGNIISLLINGAFFPLQKSQHWKETPKTQATNPLLIAKVCIGIWGTSLHPGRRAGALCGASSGCWPSSSSVSTAALLLPTPSPSCNIIRLFSPAGCRKKAIGRVLYLCWNICEGLMYYGIWGSSRWVDLRR